MTKKTTAEIEKIRVAKQDDFDISLLILFDQTSSVLTTAVELELKSKRMTQPQARILHMLSRENKPATMDELADWTYKGYNSVSTLINRMEKRGLVKKIKKDGDLKTYIVPTEEGNIVYHKEVTERSIHLIFDKLTDNEKQQLFTLLTKVRDTTSNILGLGFRPSFLD